MSGSAVQFVSEINTVYYIGLMQRSICIVCSCI